MTTTNKFDRSFGPVASFSGIIVFIIGLGMCIFTYVGPFFVLLGAFIGFTNESTSIDYEKKQIRFTNNIFGFIRVGKWLSVNQDMYLGVNRCRTVYRTFSRSNRKLDITREKTELCLLDKFGKTIVPLKKIKNPDDTTKELYTMRDKLGIQIKNS